MDAFSLARELVGKKGRAEQDFLKLLKPAKEPVDLKGATRLGKYLYKTADSKLVSLAIVKSKPQQTEIAYAVIELQGLYIYVLTNE